MEIEVITTKKKLTKAIVKQLEPATDAQIEIFNNSNEICHGFYVRGLGKGFTERIGLFQSTSGSWVIFGIRQWELSKSSKKRAVANANRFIDFETEAKASRFVDVMNSVGDRCLKNHLIL